MPKPVTQNKKSGGFRVGPKRLDRSVYTGHQDKIKATLIHKAKVKKSYYKDLASEGYATGVNGGQLGERGSKSNKNKNGGSSDVKMKDDDAEEEEENVDEDTTNPGGSNKGKGRATNNDNNSSNSNRNSSTSTNPSTPIVPIKKPRLTSPEIALIKEKKIAERKEWGQKSSRGQPKLGGRVEMLLARIKKSMA